jgi:hypothetical protein
MPCLNRGKHKRKTYAIGVFIFLQLDGAQNKCNQRFVFVPKIGTGKFSTVLVAVKSVGFNSLVGAGGFFLTIN